MSATLVHRGPDDDGLWVDAAAGIALGHRRLAIVDLSAGGHQPMTSASGRLVLVYNGEIYNHRELRVELSASGCAFRGTSDTETLLAAIETWGLERTLERLNGMFAFAVWDTAARQLSLARDRIGIKPLYYGWVGRQFLFGSELKALRACPSFSTEIDRNALALYLQHNYVPGPHSIYRGIRKLTPGTHLTIASPDIDAAPVPYWSFHDLATSGVQHSFSGSDTEAVQAFDQRLREAVALRMRADVPLGAFLSGGLDSTAIVATAQAQSERPMETFCIGFEDPSYDESNFAQALARHLKTVHTTLRVSAQEAQHVIALLPALYDEPFADASQIPTYLVSKMARQAVTVSLSGDGGDELLGGYERYALAERIWNGFCWFPLCLRRPAARLLQAPPLDAALPRKVRTAARLLSAASPRELYTRLHQHWPHPETVVAGGRAPEPLHQIVAGGPIARSPREEMMYIDTQSYLPDDILVKIDRASMGVGLEARVPFLDHRLVEFAWTLPAHFKVRNGRSKWLLRRLLDQYVPRSLVERPKVGFGVPIDAWLRGSLRDWAESLLDEQRLAAEGFFRPAPIREKWQQHLRGDCDWHYHLWDVLMFQAWLEHGG